MKKVLLSASLVSVLFLAGCDQWFARHTGGNYDLNLPCNERLENITWKDNNIWVLSTPMEDNYKPIVHYFREDSTLELLEGTVTIKETRCSE